jgi:hypothetical protein
MRGLARIGFAVTGGGDRRLAANRHRRMRLRTGVRRTPRRRGLSSKQR